nr:MAG TPA: hypothetical protein [Bacteriophage sp.]
MAYIFHNDFPFLLRICYFPTHDTQYIRGVGR